MLCELLYRADEMPALQAILVQTHEPTGPFGAKAIAEIPKDGVAPAIANAVFDATGARLRRIYSDKDLLAAECLRAGSWKRLTPAELAAVVSMLIHEARRDEADLVPRIPTDEVAIAWEDMQQRWREIEAREERAGLEVTGYPDAGIAWAVHRWASGRRLDEVLDGSELTAGDFVRRCKQIVDLLDQVAKASQDERMRTTARKAIDGVMRGVVAADRID